MDAPHDANKMHEEKVKWDCNILLQVLVLLSRLKDNIRRPCFS